MLTDFTFTQKKILRLIVLGYSNVQIAKKMEMTYSKVVSCVRLIQTRLNVANRIHCAIVGANLLGIGSKIILDEIKKLDE